jgi:hypothetical protein
MAEQLKKPVGGAYGVFLAEKREEFTKQAAAAGEKGVTGVAKRAGAAWTALSDAEKAPYEAKYQAKKTEYDSFKSSDAYVAPEKKAKKGSRDAKPAKDKDAPKRPAGGAYGIFMSEKREEFKTKAVAAGDHPITGTAKLASAAWKDVGEAEKAEYEKKYQEAKAKYEEDMAAYRLSKPAEEEPPAGKKRLSDEKGPAPKRRNVRTASAGTSVNLPADVLKEADGLGYRTQLENLAGRKAIVDAGYDAPKMLRALKASGGLVNKAQYALLGA